MGHPDEHSGIYPLCDMRFTEVTKLIAKLQEQQAVLHDWKLTHSTEVDGWWKEQWRDNKDLLRDLEALRTYTGKKVGAVTQDMNERFTAMDTRVRKQELGMSNIAGKLAVYATIGATLGGGLVALVVSLLP